MQQVQLQNAKTAAAAFAACIITNLIIYCQPQRKNEGVADKKSRRERQNFGITSACNSAVTSQ